MIFYLTRGKTMLKIDLNASIDSIPFLLYMEEREKDSKAANTAETAPLIVAGLDKENKRQQDFSSRQQD